MIRWWRRRADPASPSASETRAQLDVLQQQLDLARALEAERQRIYDDLHDDIGGRLLTLLHRLQDPGHQQLVREVLQDLRAILARERGAGCSLLEALAQLRDEAEQRLDTRGIELEWRQGDGLPDPALDPAQAMHLFRIGREALTNALRHAAPRLLRVVIEQVGQDLVFEVTDDGRFDPARIGSGRGTRSMQARAGELQGDIHWQAGTMGGTKVRLRFPLPPPASTGWPQPASGGTLRR